VARILIADDNADAREALALILRSAGHDVANALDGQETIDLYRARRFDVVLLDLLMPKVDGFEVLRVLKREFPDVRVLVISGAWRIGGRDALGVARELGATAAILKPVDPQLVVQAVEELLSLTP
jgi:CheY-like chemotaxis protein